MPVRVAGLLELSEIERSSLHARPGRPDFFAKMDGMISVGLRALLGKLNQTSRAAMERAAGVALSRTHYALRIEHLLLQFLDSPANDCLLIFRYFGIDLPRFKMELSALLDNMKTGSERNPDLDESLIAVLKNAWLCGSLDYQALHIRSGHIVVAMLTEQESKALVDAVPELQKISWPALRRNLMNIAEGSVEGGEDSVAAAQGNSSGYAFFSYSHKDSGTVVQFAKYLAYEEIPPFIDGELEYGDAWETVLVDRIKRSELLMVLMSGNSRNSEFVKREIQIALGERKRIVPILVDGEPFEQLKELQHIRLLDTVHPRTRFIEHLRKLLAPNQIPSAALQRRRLENFILDLFETTFGVDQGSRTYLGFGDDIAFNVSLDKPLSDIDELDWGEVFSSIRERIPDLKIDTRFGKNYSERYPTIKALVDDLYGNLTWMDISKL
jgi:hypothetical protein